MELEDKLKYLNEIELKPIVKDGSRYYTGEQIQWLLTELRLAWMGKKETEDLFRKALHLIEQHQKTIHDILLTKHGVFDEQR